MLAEFAHYLQPRLTLWAHRDSRAAATGSTDRIRIFFSSQMHDSYRLKSGSPVSGPSKRNPGFANLQERIPGFATARFVPQPGNRFG